jgi:hypothetical protein
MELVIQLSDEMTKITRDIEYIAKDKAELSEINDKIEELEPEYVLL